MNIEDLSKSQLLLLTILVNFVTAIATAVMTVSLLDEAPATITQTVNRIVDHTIETVTMQVPSEERPAASRDEELLTSAVAANAARAAYIHRGATSTPVLATAVYLPKSRAIATARQDGLPREVVVAFANGQAAEASLSSSNNSISIYGFSDTAALPDAPAASPIAAADLKPGQTVISINESGNVVTGIVSKVDATGIYTTLPSVPAGSGAVSLGGNIIGVASGATGFFVSTDQIMSLLEPASAP